MDTGFRIATSADHSQIWEILQGAIARRKEEGSLQWQNGYPNPLVVQNDIDHGYGFVLTSAEQIIGYCALMLNDEPAYANIEGKWLSDQDSLVVHRVAISANHLGKGLAQQMLKHVENHAVEKGIFSIKADTNFDNIGMLNIFRKMGYTYCGEVYVHGAARKAFEKLN